MVYVNFQDLWNKFSFLFGQLCDKKTCAFVMMGIGRKIVWAGGGIDRGHWVDSVLFVGVCVCVGQRVGIIRHQMLLWQQILVTVIFHDHFLYCEIFLACFLISFVFNKGAWFLIEFQAFI